MGTFSKPFEGDWCFNEAHFFKDSEDSFLEELIPQGEENWPMTKAKFFKLFSDYWNPENLIQHIQYSLAILRCFLQISTDAMIRKKGYKQMENPFSKGTIRSKKGTFIVNEQLWIPH